MDFSTAMAVITAVVSVLAPIIVMLWGANRPMTPEKHVKLLEAKARRAGLAVAKPGEPYYASTWDAVQRGEEAARANVWPDGVPDYTSDLDSALEAILGPPDRCPDCEWEVLQTPGGVVKWVESVLCDEHGFRSWRQTHSWQLPQGYAFSIEMGNLRNMGLTMREAAEAIKLGINSEELE